MRLGQADLEMLTGIRGEMSKAALQLTSEQEKLWPAMMEIDDEDGSDLWDLPREDGSERLAPDDGRRDQKDGGWSCCL